MDSIAIHSHKGGVGKTTISVNLAVMYAKMGKNVCLVDADFNAPNLHTFFDVETDKYLNKFFENKISMEDCIHKVNFSKDEIPGNLYIALADPTPDSINAMIRLDARSATNILTRLLKIKAAIKNPPYDVEYLILDTTPGVSLTTINAFVLTENILFIIKLSNADIDGTRHMIQGLLENLPNRSLMIANQIPAEKISDSEQKGKLNDLINNKFQEDGITIPIEFLGWIATDAELQLIEFENAVLSLSGEDHNRVIFTKDIPDHPFSTSLKEIENGLFL